MKVTIIADLQDESCKDHFISVITAVGHLSGVTISVVDDEPAAEAPAVDLDALAAEIKAKEADMEAQAAPPAEFSMELPAIEIPAVEIPAEEVPITVANEPAVELEKEPETLPSSAEVTGEVDVGKVVVMSLTSANSVPAIIAPKADKSYLSVTTDVVSSDGLLDFWYGSIEFRVPPAVDAAAVINPSHPIGPTTIRVVVRKMDSSDTVALLVDVIRGDMELLTISGADAASGFSG
jgi:hypothetical protein